MSSAAEAATALQAEAERQKKLAGPVYLGISLTSDAVKERQYHPELVPLPHKTRRKADVLSCLIVKDPQNKVIEVLEKTAATSGLFDEIIGVGKLRRRLANKRAIDEFTKTFAYVFVQDKVARPLREVLGAHFYKTSRHLPIVITLDGGETGPKVLNPSIVRHQVKKALKSSQLVLRPAPFASVLVGHTQMENTRLAENVDAAATHARVRFPEAKLNIKTPESMSLALA